MSTELIITSSAFYRNSLYLERKMSGEVAVASGRYTTRYGIVELYGENYGHASKRKPYFSFDFTHEGRNYRCYFEEWLTDATIRLRALRFVEQCRALAPEPIPTPWAYQQACAALEKHRKRADAAEPWAMFFRDGKTIGEISDALGEQPAREVVRKIASVVREIESGETQQRLVVPTPAPKFKPKPVVTPPTKEALAALFWEKYRGQLTRQDEPLGADDILGTMAFGDGDALHVQVHIRGFTDWYALRFDASGQPDPATIEKLPF
jgi:hypothetical protein